MIGEGFREWLKPLIMKEGLGVVGEWQGFALHKNLRAANWQPSTNTKTKLDLTKASQDFHKPLNAVANIRKLSEFCIIILHFFALKWYFSIKWQSYSVKYGLRLSLLPLLRPRAQPSATHMDHGVHGP